MAAESSSVLRLYHPGEGEYLLNQDDPLSAPLPRPPELTEAFTWEKLEDFKLNTTAAGLTRSIEEIHQINKVLKCCVKIFPPNSKKPDGTPANRSCFDSYDKMMKHYKLFEANIFSVGRV
jgi:hypothetical protein